MTEAESTIKVRRTTPAARALALLTAFAVALVPTAAVAPTPSRAQSLPPGLPVIRDAEIEQLLRDYTQPILRAAGLAQQNVQVTIINDRSFNAFVMDGRRIFINAGALVDAKVPNEVIGVLAHETGHMAGGHLSRLRQQLANAQAASIIAMILGLGGAIAASRGGAGGGAPVSPWRKRTQSFVPPCTIAYARASRALSPAKSCTSVAHRAQRRTRPSPGMSAQSTPHGSAIVSRRIARG